jgi:hypothetical protein
MKKAFAIITFVLVAVFYCFAIETMPLYAHDSTGDFPQEESAEKTSFFSLTSGHLTARPPSSQNSGNNNTQPVFADFNYFCNGLLAIIASKEPLFTSAYTQYSFCAINFLIEQKKSNLLYPFHYFW